MLHIHHLLIMPAAMFQTTPAPSPSPIGDAQNFGNMVTLNMVAVWLLQWLKKTSLVPFITNETAKLNKITSLTFAAVGAAGVSIVTTHTGTGAWTIAVSGLSFWPIAHYVWSVLGNYATQKGLYKLIFSAPNGAPLALKP